MNYNIINLNENYISKKHSYKLLDKKQANKKKGLSEQDDLMRPFAPNYNENYLKQFNENNDMFKKTDGMFTYMYDRAAKNGGVTPFGNRDNKLLSSLNVEHRYTMKNARKRQEYFNKKSHYGLNIDLR